jgi:hypothetical protein
MASFIDRGIFGSIDPDHRHPLTSVRGSNDQGGHSASAAPSNPTLGEQPRFRVRETPDWKQHAADLEAEMIKRGMIFEVIDWSEDPDWAAKGP